MDFARRILQSYGWKEGDGLGKTKNGIAKPLKATLKFDKAGFGADQAVDFNNHWWQRVYDESATNVNITQEGEEIRMTLKDDEKSVEISTKGFSVKKLKELKKTRKQIGENKNIYENFLQAATLTNLGDEVENSNKIDMHDIEVSKVNVLTDEELFKACGGRTAHKGARHGLKLSGKLARLEQQEAELLSKMLAKQASSIDCKPSKNDLEGKLVTVPEKCAKKSIREIKQKTEDEAVAKCDHFRKKKRKHQEKSNESDKNCSELVVVKMKKKKSSITQNDDEKINRNLIPSNEDREKSSLKRTKSKSGSTDCIEDVSQKKKKKCKK